MIDVRGEVRLIIHAVVLCFVSVRVLAADTGNLVSDGVQAVQVVVDVHGDPDVARVVVEGDAFEVKRI